MNQTTPLTPFHAQPTDDVLANLSSHITGITETEAGARLSRYGRNEIPEKARHHPILIFLKQFHSTLIYLLFAAALISVFYGHMIDVYVILTVILINAFIGFLQEYKAEGSIRALKKMMVPTAKVYRDGELLQIDAREVVVGDILYLESGDRIAADARIIELRNFRTVESSLTGESLPTYKNTDTLPEKTPLTDRSNMIWMGTFVANGECKAVVTATGTETVLGKIAGEIEQIKRGKGYFEKKTDTLAKKMAAIAITGASITFLVGYFIRGFEFNEIFLFTIASLVSGIPEGLPAVLAIVLAIGAYRMARRNAIIRSLPSTETLGVVSVIMTDKTGTITENTMTIEKVLLPGREDITVTGSDWDPIGDFFQKNRRIVPLENKDLSKLLHMASVCNNARILKKEGQKKYTILGDPTEAALVVLAEKAGLKKDVVEESDKLIDDLPFDPELKYRATLSLRENEKKKDLYVIGAPETVLSHCMGIRIEGEVVKLTEEHEKEILERIDGQTKNAMRLLALAYRESPPSVCLSEHCITGLVYVGMVGMKDPPRPEVKEAIEKAKTAGVRIMMVTGDHKNTAIEIAKEVGIIEEDTKTGKDYPLALTEEELSHLSEKEFQKAVKNVCVFARLTPSTKLRIAETLQNQGHIVAMTGDGVNDAPALKKADVGVSMGIIGTDVARESSEIVLADDNFASIVSAIEEGRIVFTNTRNASSFLITTNFAEDVTIITTLLLGLPLPLLATQILWLNLVTDTLNGGSLAFEPSHGGILKEPPRKKTEGILTWEIFPFLIFMSATMAILTVSLFTNYLPAGIDKARTVAFTVMAFTQLFNAINMRSLRYSIHRIGLFSNRYLVASFTTSIILLCTVIYIPFLQEAFRFVPLGAWDLIAVVTLSSSVLWLGELYKFIHRRQLNKRMIRNSAAI